MRKLLCMAFMATWSASFAQIQTYQSVFDNGTSDEVCWGVADIDGYDVMVSGMTGASLPTLDAPILMRVDANGQLVFSNTYNVQYGCFLRVRPCPINGGFIAVGVGMNPTTNTRDIILAHVDANGNNLMATEIAFIELPYAEAANDIVELSDGSFVIVGTTSTSQFGHALVLNFSFDSSGNVLVNWINEFGAAGTQAIGVCENTGSSPAIVVVGATQDYLTPQTFTTVSTPIDLFMSNFSFTGTMTDFYAYSSSICSHIGGIDVIYEGSADLLYVTGDCVNEREAIRRGYVLCTDPALTPQWYSEYTSNLTNQQAQSSFIQQNPVSGNLVLGCYAAAGSAGLGSLYDALLFDVDPANGNVVNSYVYGNSSSECFNDMIVQPSGAVVAVGYTEGGWSFSSVPNNYYVVRTDENLNACSEVSFSLVRLEPEIYQTAFTPTITNPSTNVSTLNDPPATQSLTEYTHCTQTHAPEFIAAGIPSIAGDDAVILRTEYLDLSGRLVLGGVSVNTDRLAPGCYVKRTRYANGHIRTEKVTFVR